MLIYTVKIKDCKTNLISHRTGRHPVSASMSYNTYITLKLGQITLLAYYTQLIVLNTPYYTTNTPLQIHHNP